MNSINARYRVKPPMPGTDGEWLVVDSQEGDRMMVAYPHNQAAVANSLAMLLNAGRTETPGMILGQTVVITRADGKFLSEIPGTGRAEWVDLPHLYRDPAAAQWLVSLYAHEGAVMKEV